MKPVALLDSNVLVAAVAEGHEHHGRSAPLFTHHDPKDLAVAAHSYAEAYATLTRAGERGLGFEPALAWAALESVHAVTKLVGLTRPRSYRACASSPGRAEAGRDSMTS